MIRIIIFLLLLSSPLLAATKYVDNSGSPSCADSGSTGAEGAPFCTVSYGVSHISAGDTLYVKNGTYAGAFTITGPSGSSGAHTIISAYPGHSPVLDAGSLVDHRMKITGACSYIEFIGFTIINHNQGLYLDDDDGTDVACTHLWITNITIHHVGQEGMAIRAGSPTGPRDFIIDGCLIYDTGALGSANGEGLYIGKGSGTDNTNGVTIQNCTIHDTPDECIELKGDSHDNIIQNNHLYNWITGTSFSNGGGCIEIDEPRNSVTDPHQIIRNNIIHDIPLTGGITKFAIRAGTGASIYNNVIYGVSSSYNCIRSDTSTYTRLIYHNTVDCSTTNAITNGGTMDSKNNIGPNTANNLSFNSSYFVDATGNNYRLAAASAPINAGSDLTATVPTDILGVSRTANGAPDLGAYEFVTAQSGASRSRMHR